MNKYMKIDGRSIPPFISTVSGGESSIEAFLTLTSIHLQLLLSSSILTPLHTEIEMKKNI